MVNMKTRKFNSTLFALLTLVITLSLPGQYFHTADRCIACHSQLTTPKGEVFAFSSDWASSMMANSARDPYWQAAIRRETLVHPSASKAIQNECAGCHMPMNRTMAKLNSLEGEVFAHLPLHSHLTPDSLLAADGVSCTMCHQIKGDNLEEKESFTAGYLVDNSLPLGNRPLYGPFETDTGRTQLMRSSSQFIPAEGKHIQSAEFCASCHTLYTHTLNEKGESIGILPEQVPYLEWKHSSFPGTASCQTCHMPEIEGTTAVSTVLGQAREKVSRHQFRGGNILLPAIFASYRNELAVKALPTELDQTRRMSLENLQSKSAHLTITTARIESGRINCTVKVNNLAGHKLPTAYPSRRVWLHLKIIDQDENILFESGKLNTDGSIAGNDNDHNASQFEPHYQVISDPGQVQIYESVMGDQHDAVTTTLLSGLKYLKDNRILPRGFQKNTAPSDCAVRGNAINDDNFLAAEDLILLDIPITEDQRPAKVIAELWYQPIGYRWAHNLKDRDAFEIKRFISYYEKLALVSAALIAQTESVLQ